MAGIHVDRQQNKPLDMRIKIMARAVIKEVSIIDYMQDIVIAELNSYYDEMPFQYKNVCRCCLHSEKTASMRYYEDTDSFYCFGCDTGGNVIRLHMEFVQRNKGIEITYEEAVEFLYNYFIMQNKTVEMHKEKSRIGLTAEEIDAIMQEENAVNENNVALMRFGKAVGKVEQVLAESLTLPLEAKQGMYNTIDTLEILVDTRNINVDAALESLKAITASKMGMRI